MLNLVTVLIRFRVLVKITVLPFFGYAQNRKFSDSGINILNTKDKLNLFFIAYLSHAGY